MYSYNLLSECNFFQFCYDDECSLVIVINELKSRLESLILLHNHPETMVPSCDLVNDFNNFEQKIFNDVERLESSTM